MIKRTTADRLLTDIQKRVLEVNESDVFAYRVSKLAVFGSYLTDKEMLGDLDVGVELEPRFDDSKQQQAFEKARIHQVILDGRQFGIFMEQLFWPQEEIMRFLKNRSTGISIHGFHEVEMLASEHSADYQMLPLGEDHE